MKTRLLDRAPLSHGINVAPLEEAGLIYNKPVPGEELRLDGVEVLFLHLGDEIQSNPRLTLLAAERSIPVILYSGSLRAAKERVAEVQRLHPDARITCCLLEDLQPRLLRALQARQLDEFWRSHRLEALEFLGLLWALGIDWERGVLPPSCLANGVLEWGRVEDYYKTGGRLKQLRALIYSESELSPIAQQLRVDSAELYQRNLVSVRDELLAWAMENPG